jgi:hypothetical protein
VSQAAIATGRQPARLFTGRQSAGYLIFLQDLARVAANQTKVGFSQSIEIRPCVCTAAESRFDKSG